MDFEKTPCTSANLRKHIQRTYYQQQLWVQAPFHDDYITLNAGAFGFERDGNIAFGLKT